MPIIPSPAFGVNMVKCRLVMPRKYFIKTYGCQMNEADSVRLAGVLESAGYQNIGGSGYQSADIVLVNTCCVRRHAEDVALQYVASLKGLKKKNPEMIIGVCGCVAAEPGVDILKRFQHVDLVLGPNEAEKLREFLKPLTPFSPSPLVRGKGKYKGEGGEFVTIMRGCDNFCSYCIVPYVRGREVSRPIDEVLEEVGRKIEQGAKRMTLLGQSINSYKYGLANLMRAMGPAAERRGSQSEEPRHSVSGSELVQFLTSHPRDMSDEIIEAVAELPYVAKEFMLPLQSGDDEILQKMNRGYNLDHYRGRIKKIRELMPHARISTDILVGFPGETEEQFQNTLKAIEEIKFNEVHMFAYSSRPGTPAAQLLDQLPEKVIKDRLQQLISHVHRLVA
ncbi:tRNA (N6-isopentenyl adenosine(37)-C2)-methylthiotransferase MiaB [Candidatus Saganbacteria bacterium]|nr:tRNA (N6-isopentenyl adenosine(37)-C2)-methylthiotransferase MiaB [Candidatus Saganbacteria bacterium]